MRARPIRGYHADIHGRFGRIVQGNPTSSGHAGQQIAKRGRMAWQKQSGYNWRALVEAAIGRYKRVIGDGLRSRTDRRRATEIAIAVGALNRMLEFGRPISVRIR
jgi:hypothetical protein